LLRISFISFETSRFRRVLDESLPECLLHAHLGTYSCIGIVIDGKNAADPAAKFRGRS
jgi:hypothetical protein